MTTAHRKTTSTIEETSSLVQQKSSTRSPSSHPSMRCVHMSFNGQSALRRRLQQHMGTGQNAGSCFQRLVAAEAPVAKVRQGASLLVGLLEEPD